ncbi:ABC transporter substrate-binding protein [Amycolatopsis pithecellobii]|uniref:Extracellular solute-binding protein n=1 Tax=Amycolatopsis pithecellobii TaxID=664692 RepID=A0A6N7Z9W7_9PSEU|nr:extracellular solute-binding protein [Amycolatopsis pithecellobii]MTD58531.1 extracellular solute-binding protein [Amycolatopsis pithecellobii]
MIGGCLRAPLRHLASLTAAIVGAAALAACGSGGDAAGGTLTLWHNYGTEANATATGDLVKAFETANPDIKINVVSQPADNYFPLLQSATISHSGPDLAVMWTGLFALKYQNLLVNLKDLVPQSALSGQKGLEYTSPGFDTSQGTLVMPMDDQFYIGYYNKALFQKAGVASVPRTWDELYDACAKLTAAGIEPLVYGNGGQALGAEFLPWYDMSYLVAGVARPEELQNLYSGRTPWTSPALRDQLDHWAQLSRRGCTNKDVLTKTDNLTDFTSGKAAMIIDGTWDLGDFEKALGGNVAPFVPPFTTAPATNVVEYSGDGFAITKSSAHKAEAAKFLEFLATPQASAIIAKDGLIPNVDGYHVTDPLAQQMLDFAATGGYRRYPMLDNVVQPEVVDVGSKTLPSVLAGNTPPATALSAMNDTLNSLPADRRGSYK